MAACECGEDEACKLIQERDQLKAQREELRTLALEALGRLDDGMARRLWDAELEKIRSFAQDEAAKSEGGDDDRS